MTGIEKAIMIKKAEKMRHEMEEIRMKVEIMKALEGKSKNNGTRKNR